LKFVAMLPMHDVNLACRELVRCVRELGAVGSFVRPNLLNGHYWHSNYWDPLYSLHEELNVTWGFHEGTGAWNSHMNALYGENRFYRHVASHWIEMQQALVAMVIGGVFEFHPKLRVGFLEAQNSWVPGLLSRIEWDYPQYRDTHAPYLTLTPKEYFQRNCWAAVEGSEPEIEATAGLIGADRMCISSDYPHFDSNFPNVSNNLLSNCTRETAAQIFMGGAHLYGFTEADFRKADAVAGATVPAMFLRSCRADRLTATGIADSPSSCHSRLCRQASFRTQSPITTISPVSSATGMNRAGGTIPSCGCRQRIKASAPMVCPVLMSI
jgi:hypothetical protein